jgi:head-tail adaptor
MPLRLGKMRHLVRVEKRDLTPQDSTGEPQLSWKLIVERRAEVKRAPGDEVWAAAGRNERVPVMLNMRYEQILFDALQSGSADVRLMLNGRVHDIASCFDPNGLKAEMTVTVKEHVEETP